MNKADTARMEALHKIGCLIAHLHGQEWTPACIHHCTRLGKKDHQKTIPLNPRHHERSGVVFGESIHLGYKIFKEKYGTEQELLDCVNSILTIDC
jgi:hypothetical protein